MKSKHNLVLTVLFACSMILPLSIDILRAEEFHVTTAAEFQRALTSARDNGEANTILLATGTYKTRDNNHSFECFPHNDITIKGESGTTSDDVILDLFDHELLFDTYDDCTSVTIEGITIRNGDGLRIISHCSGDITLRNNKILNAYMGMQHLGGARDIFLFDNTIENNTCGGIRLKYSGDITLENNIITENKASRWGGGVYIEESGNIYINNNIISGNASDHSYNDPCPRDYTAGNSGGGGMWITKSGNVTLTNNTVMKNSTSYGTGSGCYVFASGDIILTNNTITRNSACGGAVGGVFGASGNCTIINNIFSDNNRMNPWDCSPSGVCSFSGDTIKLTNNTITRNDVSGGAVVTINGHTVYVYNNIVWGNVGDDVDNKCSIDDSTYVYNNIMGRLITGLKFFTEDVNNIDEDPLLTDDYHLLPDSPCIDNGTADAPELPSTDYEGDSRTIGSAPDIGADEFDPSNPPTTTSTSSTTTTPISTTTTSLPQPPSDCLSEELYGEYSEQTELLRHFRDNILTQTPTGKELIKLYYQWSPVIVKAMEEDEEFREDIKEIVDHLIYFIGATP